jgi:bifunctional non-homologous end joining protein LigD
MKSTARTTRNRPVAQKARRRTRFQANGLIPVEIPSDRDVAEVQIGDRRVRLTNLRKLFWPELGVTKGDLLRYYAKVSDVLIPHLRDRAMVMKRYPGGASGEFFFMKRAPAPRPEWIRICSIEHSEDNVIDFPVVDDVATLLWLVNLGCIDLNQWYARCDDVDRPDYLHFDLDPVAGASFAKVREAALVVHEALEALHMPATAKTTGSRGIHVYVPIVRGPAQKDVWGFTKEVALTLAASRSRLLTAEYRVARRPAGRVLIDYNQNAWGRTLASVYSVRPRPRPTVSMPVTWKEIEEGVDIDDFDIENAPARIAELGDLWAPLLDRRRRFDLARYV